MKSIEKVLCQALPGNLTNEVKNDIVRKIYLDDCQNGLEWDIKENGHFSPIMVYYPNELGAAQLIINADGSAVVWGYEENSPWPIVELKEEEFCTESEFAALRKVVYQAGSQTCSNRLLLNLREMEKLVQAELDFQARKQDVEKLAEKFEREHGYPLFSVSQYLQAFPEKIIGQKVAKSGRIMLLIERPDGREAQIESDRLNRRINWLTEFGCYDVLEKMADHYKATLRD